VKSQHERIQEFIAELTGFAATAENVLKRIEADLEGNKHLFSLFYERMFAIRGTSQQLNLNHVAKIAELGEEIAIKGTTAQTRPQIRKCVGSLWDALTTVKHLLIHYTEETTEEQEILMRRLENTLRVLGGSRTKVDMSQIEALFSKRS
jgi:hypothetical protein